jgi:hypothetical protein
MIIIHLDLKQNTNIIFMCKTPNIGGVYTLMWGDNYKITNYKITNYEITRLRITRLQDYELQDYKITRLRITRLRITRLQDYELQDYELRDCVPMMKYFVDIVRKIS